MPLADDELQRLYTWVDEIPLSRPKRNIARDFSDAVLTAEVVHKFHPKLVELHNYNQANSVSQKQYNWQTMNKKVFKKLGFQLSKQEIDDIVHCKPQAVERTLIRVQKAVARYKGRPLGGGRKQPRNESPDELSRECRVRLRTREPQADQSRVSVSRKQEHMKPGQEPPLCGRMSMQALEHAGI